jgi:2-oxoglutarate ferredoxin oxidoreductase subunit delta
MALAVRWNGDEAALLDLPLRVIIDAERCKGCRLCLAVCPPDVLAMGGLNQQGYPVAILLDAARCTSCTACALICPEAAITVYRPPTRPRPAGERR